MALVLEREREDGHDSGEVLQSDRETQSRLATIYIFFGEFILFDTCNDTEQ